eukprot:530778-Pelagomonas_calceolata.AAC.1
MLYADDLALTANNHTHMQAMLNKLQVYATRKYLAVNTQKSEVVCFNSRIVRLPPLLFDGDSLSNTNLFRYLGMVCNKPLNLSTAAEAALKPYIAGTYCVKTLANDYNLTNRLHTFIWLLRTHAKGAQARTLSIYLGKLS